MNIGELLKDAKDALKGNWVNAIISNIILSIMAFIIAFIFIFVVIFVFIAGMGVSSNGFQDYSYNSSAIAGLAIGGLLVYFLAIIIISLFIGLFYTGYRYSILDAIDTKKLGLVDFFGIFRQQPLKVLGLLFMQGLFVFLWSLLLIVPGIIKTYSYSQALYILKENPNMKILDCITESRKMMDGYKLSLFGATFLVGLVIAIPSAIMGAGIEPGSYDYYYGSTQPALGAMYYVGSILTLVVSIVVIPYMYSLYAVFYRKLTGKSNEPSETEERVSSIDIEML